MNRARIIGVLSAIAAAAIWGGMYVVSKPVLEVIPPLKLLMLRIIVALPILLIAHRLQRERWLSRSHVGAFVLIALVGYGISLGAQFAGTKLSNASNGALITSATPAFVVPFAFWLLGERVTRQKLIGLALATLGVLIVVARDINVSELGGSFAGNALLVLAAITWALYSVLVKRVTAQGVSSLSATLFATMFGSAFVLPMALIEPAPIQSALVTPSIIAGVLFLGIVAMAGAFYLWNKGFELLDANTAALCFFAQPLVGAALGAWLLHETLGVGFFVGAALIAIGTIISQIEVRQRQQNAHP